MKKALSIFGAILLLISLSACGNSKPGKTSDAMYQIGLNALQTADDYIEGKITGDEAADKLKEYKNQAASQKEKDCEKLGVDSLIGTEFSNNALIESDIYSLYRNVDNIKNDITAMSDVREARDDLAEQLGKKRAETTKTTKTQKTESKYSYDELKEIQDYINTELSVYGFKYGVSVNEREEKVDIYISLKLSYFGAEETFADTVEWAVPIIQQARENYEFDLSKLDVTFLLYTGSLKEDSDAAITYSTSDLSVGLLIDTKTKVTKSFLPYKNIREELCK